MGAHVVTVTKRGQITIPADIRRRLGIVKGDRLWVRENDRGHIVLSRLLTVKDLQGSLPALSDRHVDDDFGNVIREAMDDRADEIVRRMKAGEE